MELPPKGAFCTHRRMRYRSCGGSCCAKRKFCFVECPDCGLTWSFFEGVFG